MRRGDSTRRRQNLPECLMQDSTAQPCLTDRELLLLVSSRNPRLWSSNSSRVLAHTKIIIVCMEKEGVLYLSTDDRSGT